MYVLPVDTVMPLINETRLEKALQYLSETDEPSAALKADMERTEYKAKALKSTVFLHHTGTVAEREALSQTDTHVMEAYMIHFESIRAYNAMNNKRQLEFVIVDVFRTLSADRRKGTL